MFEKIKGFFKAKQKIDVTPSKKPVTGSVVNYLHHEPPYEPSKTIKLKDVVYSDSLTNDSTDYAYGCIERSFSSNDPIAGYFSDSTAFIGYQECAILSTNWLIENACKIPVEEALRKSYSINPELEELRKYDSKFKLKERIEETLLLGRFYGGALVYFDIRDSDPEERNILPFNPDGVAKNSYKAIKVISPEYAKPDLNARDVLNPLSDNFNKPSHWWIGTARIHATHLLHHVPSPVASHLLPEYNYFGMPLTQRMKQSTYMADRSFNESCLLLLQKRLLVVKTERLDNESNVYAMGKKIEEQRSNSNVLFCSPSEDIFSVDTPLGDIDGIVMNLLQRVSSSCNVPATKLLGIQPKGFNSTGEHEAENYRMNLENIRINLVNPILERHYYLLQLSLGMEPIAVNIQWESLDSQTEGEKERAQKDKMDALANLVNSGIATPDIAFKILAKDKNSPFFGMDNLEDEEEEDLDLDDEDEEEELGNG